MAMKMKFPIFGTATGMFAYRIESFSCGDDDASCKEKERPVEVALPSNLHTSTQGHPSRRLSIEEYVSWPQGIVKESE